MSSCFSENNSDSNQTFDLRGLSGEVLLLAAKNVLSGKEGSELVISSYEVTGNSMPETSNTDIAPDANGPSMAAAALALAGGNGVGSKRNQVQNAQVEFSVKYIVLP